MLEVECNSRRLGVDNLRGYCRLDICEDKVLSGSSCAVIEVDSTIVGIGRGVAPLSAGKRSKSSKVVLRTTNPILRNVVLEILTLAIYAGVVENLTLL